MSVKVEYNRKAIWLDGKRVEIDGADHAGELLIQGINISNLYTIRESFAEWVPYILTSQGKQYFKGESHQNIHATNIV